MKNKSMGKKLYKKAEKLEAVAKKMMKPNKSHMQCMSVNKKKKGK